MQNFIFKKFKKYFHGSFLSYLKEMV